MISPFKEISVDYSGGVMTKEISRRSFLKGVVVAACDLATAGVFREISRHLSEVMRKLCRTWVYGILRT